MPWPMRVVLIFSGAGRIELGQVEPILAVGVIGFGVPAAVATSPAANLAAMVLERPEQTGSYVAVCFGALLLYQLAPDDFVAVDLDGHG